VYPYIQQNNISNNFIPSNNLLGIFDFSYVLILFVILLLIVFVFFFLRYIFLQFAAAVKEASIEKKSLNSIILEVRLPMNNEIEIQAADQMFSSLLSISEQYGKFAKLFRARTFISFEIVALPETIRFYVVVPKNIGGIIEKVINSAYPTAEVSVADEYNIFSENGFVEFGAMKLANDTYKPIRTYEELSTDSIAGLLTNMSKIGSGEAVAFQIIITAAGSEWRNKGKSFVNKVRKHNADPEKKSKMDVPEDLLGAIEKKCEKGGFYIDMRMVAVANSPDIAKNYIESMQNSFSQFSKEGSNYFKPVSGGSNFVKDFIYRTTRETFILNTAELASVFHFPNKKIETPHINWMMSKRAPATSGIPSQGDLWVGMNIYRDVKKQIFMMRDDRRRHMYMIGKTGAGKSFVMQQMALQDIINGEGIAFLDPHGDSADWLLERIPPHRIEDVIYWNPGDTDRPLGFNILEFYDEQDKHRTVNSFIGLMQKMFDPHNQGITGPRFERAVRNAMLSVMEKPGATLVEVLRILSDEKYQQKIIPTIKDDIVRRYWTDEIAKTQEFHKSEVLGYIVSKFDRFVTNKLTRNIFGQSKSGFNMRQIMDNQKILIVNLSKGMVGEENAQFLGLLMVPRILSSAMSRADTAEHLRKDFYLYVDEFQNFSTNDFAQILSEARKYRLNLIVANQYIAQIDEKIRDAVFGNVGTVVSMKVGQTDAQFLSETFKPIFDVNDLVNLENVNAYVKLLYQGESPPAFSINTHYKYAPYEIPKEGNKKVAEIVKNLSRYRYGRDKALVESEIVRRADLAIEKPAEKPTNTSFGNSYGGGMGSPLKPSNSI
jgi:hypothetical protein